MKQYLDVLRKVREQGLIRDNRTGIKTQGLFGEMMRFDLKDGFPLLTTKKVFFRGIAIELIWFIRGETNIKYLIDRDVHIWDEWAFQKYLRINALESAFPKYSSPWRAELKKFAAKIKEDASFAVEWGELGPVYGHQWRHWSDGQGGEIDQLKMIVHRIKEDPNDRRLIITAWNPVDVPHMALPPCHCFFHFYVANGRLSCVLYQRSCDMFLGVPFNIASYSLLLTLIAKISGLESGDFVHLLGDTHIYENHFAQVEEQLKRNPRPLPRLEIIKDIKTLEDIESLEFADLKVVGYDPLPAIKGEVAV